MEIQVSSVGAATVVRPVGEFQVTTLDEIRKAIDGALKKGAAVVDLSTVDFIDSSALGLLVSFAKKPLWRGAFRLAAPRPVVSNVIQISRLDRILEIHASLDAATAKPAPRRILIVEPDEATRAIAEGILESHDYAVQSVAAAGLAEPCAFDLVVAGDAPQNELEAARKVSGNPPLLAFVARREGPASAIESVQTDELAYLAKPFDPYDFLGKVRILLKDRSGAGAEVLACIASKSVAEQILFILDRHDYRLTLAATAGSFSPKLVEKSWSAIIVDARPTGSAVENLIAEVHDRFGELAPPVLVLGEITSNDVMHLVQAGACDFLSVPVVPESVVGKLAKHVRIGAAG